MIQIQLNLLQSSDLLLSKNPGTWVSKKYSPGDLTGEKSKRKQLKMLIKATQMVIFVTFWWKTFCKMVQTRKGDTLMSLEEKKKSHFVKVH